MKLYAVTVWDDLNEYPMYFQNADSSKQWEDFSKDVKEAIKRTLEKEFDVTRVDDSISVRKRALKHLNIIKNFSEYLKSNNIHGKFLIDIPSSPKKGKVSFLLIKVFGDIYSDNTRKTIDKIEEFSVLKDNTEYRAVWDAGVKRITINDVIGTKTFVEEMSKLGWKPVEVSIIEEDFHYLTQFKKKGGSWFEVSDCCGELRL